MPAGAEEHEVRFRDEVGGDRVQRLDEQLGTLVRQQLTDEQRERPVDVGLEVPERVAVRPGASQPRRRG